MEFDAVNEKPGADNEPEQDAAAHDLAPPGAPKPFRGRRLCVIQGCAHDLRVLRTFNLISFVPICDRPPKTGRAETAGSHPPALISYGCRPVRPWPPRRWE